MKLGAWYGPSLGAKDFPVLPVGRNYVYVYPGVGVDEMESIQVHHFVDSDLAGRGVADHGGGTVGQQ